MHNRSEEGRADRLAEGRQFSVQVRSLPARMAYSIELCQKGAMPRAGREVRGQRQWCLTSARDWNDYCNDEGQATSHNGLHIHGGVSLEGGAPSFFVLTKDDSTGNGILKFCKMCTSDERETFHAQEGT